MYYEYARSEGCNRFSIAGRRSITVTPTAKTQMILGTNGSGKSSMLSILWSPFPASPDDFDGNGEREVHILHKGHRYEIKETFGNRNVYSFQKDGVELNRDGKVTPQWALCEEHFDFDRSLHDLWVGKLRFTDMSPQKRRDWIAKLSTLDFDYAFQEYDRYRKGHSKAKAIVEHLQSRINEETDRLIREEDLIKMREHVQELHDTLDALMREPRSNQAPIPEAEIREQFDSVCRRIEGFLTKEFPVVGDLTQDLAEQTEKINQLKGELTARGERVAELEQRYLRIANLLEGDPEVIERQIVDLKAELAALETRRLPVPDELLVPAEDALIELRQILVNLPDDYVSQGEVAKILQEAQIKRQKANRIEGAMREITLEIDHIKRCASATCPQCSYVFKPGIEPGRLEMLEGRAAKGTEHLVKAGCEASEAEDWLAQTSEKANLFTALEQIKERYRQCSGLWMHLDNCGGLQKGRGLLHELPRYETAVDRAQQRTRASKRLAELEAAMAQWKQEAGGNAQLLEDLTAAREAYTDLHARYRVEVERWQELDRQLKYEESWNTLAQGAQQEYEKLQASLKVFMHQAIDRDREELIRKTRTTLAINEQALSENEVIAAVVKDLENQLAKALVEEEAYRRLVSAICPKTGLIAEKITEQIGAIVGKMNQLISTVWGYPLYIKVPEADDSDVTYKFPMVVDGRLRNDIAEGSKSIKSIVNTAFQLVTYYCRGLVDYPLYLDEPSEGFDEVHVQNLIPVIKDLVDNARFSQIFIISHDIDAQTAFPNSQTIIMDERNIPNYPYAYNLHVEVA